MEGNMKKLTNEQAEQFKIAMIECFRALKDYEIDAVTIDQVKETIREERRKFRESLT